MALFSFLMIVSFVGVLFFTPIAANDHGVTFQWPIAGLTINYLDVVNVTYRSSFATPRLFTFCYNESDTTTLLTMLQQNVPPYNSSELVIINWPHLNSCHFDLRPNNSGGSGANSPSFAINNTARLTPVTLGIDQPTSISTSTSTLTSTASSASSDASSDASSSSPSSSSKTPSGSGVGIGIGVSVGVAVIAFAALGFWLLRRRKSGVVRGTAAPDYDGQNNTGQSNIPRDQKWAPVEMGYGGGEGIYMQHVGIKGMKPQPQEMPAAAVYEMPADTRRMR